MCTFLLVSLNQVFPLSCALFSCRAWGKCANPAKCWQCKRGHDGQVKISADVHDGEHLMMYVYFFVQCVSLIYLRSHAFVFCRVYPDKEGRMVDIVMGFFKKRFKNHLNIYTHPTTIAACYMICDILILADPYFRISNLNEGEDLNQDTAKAKKDKAQLELPISRAMINDGSYLQLKDSILDQIAATKEPSLRPARILIKRFRSRKLYKMVAQQELTSDNGIIIDAPWQSELWDMTESEIAREIVKCSEIGKDADISITDDDIIVEKRSIHHGMKTNNRKN